jgi:hypothetical protein
MGNSTERPVRVLSPDAAERQKQKQIAQAMAKGAFSKSMKIATEQQDRVIGTVEVKEKLAAKNSKRADMNFPAPWDPNTPAYAGPRYHITLDDLICDISVQINVNMLLIPIHAFSLHRNQKISLETIIKILIIIQNSIHPLNIIFSYFNFSL